LLDENVKDVVLPQPATDCEVGEIVTAEGADGVNVTRELPLASQPEGSVPGVAVALIV
jgi:hypothetical protein